MKSNNQSQRDRAASVTQGGRERLTKEPGGSLERFSPQ